MTIMQNVALALAGMVAGVCLALCAYYGLYGKVEYVSVIDLGSGAYSSSAAAAKVAIPGILEFVQAPEFAALVADDAGDDALEQTLPARRYNGAGDISARQIRSGRTIELHVKGATRDQALRAATSATEVLVSLALAAKDIQRPDETIDSQWKALSGDVISRIQIELLTGDAVGAAALLSAFNEIGLGDIPESNNRAALPSIIVPPVSTLSYLGSPLRMAIAGGIAGLCSGIFAAFSIRRRREISEADQRADPA